MMQSLFCPLLDENDNVAAPAVFTGNGDRDTPFFFWTAETDEEIQAIYDEVYSWRDQDDFEYMIDGVVFEFAALEDIELLGGRQCDCPDCAGRGQQDCSRCGALGEIACADCQAASIRSYLVL